MIYWRNFKIIITNPPKQRTFGHCATQPDWANLTLPYIANFFPNPQIVDNSHRYSSPELKGNIAISIRSEKEYQSGLEMITKFGIKFAGGQSAWHHREELTELGLIVIKEKDAGLPFDDTPMPRWDLVEPIKSQFFKGRYTGSIEMSRGCPFSCDFCAVNVQWKDFRQKSNERIIEELNYLKSLNRTHIYLTDDSFGIDVPKHKDLFEKIKSFDMKFFTQIRADTIAKNPQMIKSAKEAGFYGFLIGFDTYDESVFSGEHKSSSVETNIKASEVCRENDIAIYGCHIYGLPSQKTPEDFETTFQLGRQNSDLFVMSYFNPLPGTKSAEKVFKKTGEWEKTYGDYYKRHQFNLREMVSALFHPNPIIRKLKRGGYKKFFNYHYGK